MPESLLSKHVNLDPQTLLQHAVTHGDGTLSAAGALVVSTGAHTGRAAQDKFIVEDDQTRDAVWWGPNKKMSPAQFDALQARVLDHLTMQETYRQDLSAGADISHAIALHLITPSAWHALFATHMFRAPLPDSDLPTFTILHAPDFKADPARDGTRSDCFVVLNFTTNTILIGGTQYAGEIKKSIFTVMNWLLPARGVLPMHCSANISKDGDTALFFGLSGTGKTTLSADPTRLLIGDDEHGWSDTSVFNIEGGCYAKAVNLSQEAEPQIFAACEHAGTVLENVVLRDDGTVDYADTRYTENTRACYPLGFLDGVAPGQVGGAPKNIIFLTCDAFGVLPPISRLTREQAMVHFLSGYTARVAGTEQGVTEPTATFSACFGAPFLPRPPQVYAELLGKKLADDTVTCWLLNTGWSGGGVGVGQRMKLSITRALLNAALSGALNNVDYKVVNFFDLAVPQSAPGVDSAPLNPRDAWADTEAYDKTARYVARLFEENYRKFK